MENTDYQYTTYPDFLNRKIIDGFRNLIKDTSKIIEYYDKHNYINETQQLKCKLSIFQKAYIVIKNYRSEIYDGKHLNGLKGISPGIPERINMILEYGTTNDFQLEELKIAYKECPENELKKDLNEDVYIVLDINYDTDSSRNVSPTSQTSGYLNSFKNVFEGVKNNIGNPLNALKNISVGKFGGGYLEDEDTYYNNSYNKKCDESYINMEPHQIV